MKRGAKDGPEGKHDRRLRRPLLVLAIVTLGFIAGALLHWSGRDPGPENSGTPAASREPLIAVLPLLDLGGGDRLYADGMTEELAVGLAALEETEVRGRATLAPRLDVNRDAAALAREVGANYALDGTMRRSGDRLRLGLRLVDAVDGGIVWESSYDTTLAAVFDVRDSAVAHVGRRLGERVDAALRRFSPRRTTTPAAWDLYLVGRYRWDRSDRGDLAEALRAYDLAIEADSAFAPAWAALAGAYATLPRFTSLPSAAVRQRGAAAARTALRLDPDSPEAHTALGEILHLYERDPGGARAHLERAIELDPGSAEPRAALCELELYASRVSEARPHCEAALSRDPESFRARWVASMVDRAAGREAGLAALAALVAANPAYEPLRAELALARLAAVGEGVGERTDADAGAATEAARDLAHWFDLLGVDEADSLASGLARLRYDGRAERDAPQLHALLDRVLARARPDPTHAAALLSLTGRSAEAENRAEAALAERRPSALAIGVLPEYRGLRDVVDAQRP